MPVKLGFIGFGIMGERLLRAALNHDKGVVAVTGTYDPSSATAVRLKAIDASIQIFDSPEAVIMASDCLHIASPPASHLDYLDRCARAGRTVLCEKPLATDIARARAAVADLTSRGARVGINFPFASSIAVEHLQRWLNAGVIGTPESIDIDIAFATWPRSWQTDAVRWLDSRSEGGFTREVGSHFLFLSRRLIGSLELKSAKCDYPDAQKSERGIEAYLIAGTLPVRMHGAVGTTVKDDHNTWTLTGSKGRIRLRDWSLAEREIGSTWRAPPDAIVNEKARSLVLARQLDKIAAMTRGSTTNLATLDEGLEVQTIVEAILSS
jgi:predicted dehydrogenase